MTDDDFPEAADVLTVLSEFFIKDGTLGTALLQIAELASKVIKPTEMAGITLLADGKLATGVFTDPEAVQIDTAQYEDGGQGPCVDAFRNQQVYRSDSTADEHRWPQFARSAAAHGITATLSLPLIARGEGIGALNLYSRTTPFSDGHARRGEVFARQAAIVLSNVQVYQDARLLGENLQEALRSRSTIDQAMGILMADGGRSPDEAFQLLTRASQRENRKLRDIATSMVQNVTSRGRPK
jgi:GAF domain-containing protein